MSKVRGVFLLTLLMAAVAGTPPAEAKLAIPYAVPAPDTQCTYQGVFAGGTEQGRWTYTVGGQGKYELRVDPPALLTGILAARTGGRPFGLTDYTYRGSEQTSGGLVTTHEVLEARVLISDAGPGSITTSVRTESACPSTPREVKPGSTWECSETITDTWSTEGAALGSDSGTTTSRRRVVTTYDRVAPYVTPWGERLEAAVLSRRDGEGGHEQVWVDPKTPWCPLKIDRLKLDRVVGTDLLVSRTGGRQSAAKQSASPAGEITLGVWALGMLLALAGALLLALGIAWLAARRQRRGTP